MTEIAETTGQERRNYMRRVYTEHIDALTDEVNATTLAEQTADHFNQAGPGGWLDDETHEVWDDALVIANEHDLARRDAEHRRQARQNARPAFV